MDKRPDPPAPRAVLFDAYGTLFDVYSVGLLAEQLFPGHGERLGTVWRDKQLAYSQLVSMGSGSGQGAHADRADRYRPFWELTRAALRHAAELLGLVLSTANEDRLMNQYRHLSSFPENREVLTALRARGVPAGILSNGDPEMLGIAVKSAGFSDLLAQVISVHPVRRFKPDPAAYGLGVQALGLPAKDVLFVSSNGWDAVGATWFGYTTLWVNRFHLPAERLDTEPTRTGDTLRDVLDFFPHSSSTSSSRIST